MRILTIALLFFWTSSLTAQKDSCACCFGPYQDFSYWLGDWDVFDSTETKIGENKIVSLQDKCVMQENWSSSNSTGTSYNYYNAADSSWNQIWIDNSGGVLSLKGGLKDGIMMLKSEKVTSKKVDYFNRIQWIPQEDDSVLQVWELVDAEDKILYEVFKGKYVRKK